MKTRTLQAASVAAACALMLGAAAARQGSTAAVAIDNDDIGGVVTSTKGPEAGVWVIAETVDLQILDPVAVARHASRERYDLVVIGPEAPLAAGVADALAAASVPVFGPSRQAARRSPTVSMVQ